MTAAVSDFEAVLASEGLEPINGPEVLAFGSMSDKAIEAVDAWTEWARAVLRTHKFSSKATSNYSGRHGHQRRVWELYAEGVPLTKMCEKLKLSRRAITRAIKRVEAKAPKAPAENPWRRSGRVTPPVGSSIRPLVVVRFAKLAVQCCDLGRLLELASDDPEIRALLPKGDEMAKEANPVSVNEKVGARRYSRILMVNNESVKVMRARSGKNDYGLLLDVLARPTNAGLDVEFETWSSTDVETRQPTVTTITIPWWKIAQADRVAGEG